MIIFTIGCILFTTCEMFVKSTMKMVNQLVSNSEICLVALFVSKWKEKTLWVSIMLLNEHDASNQFISSNWLKESLSNKIRWWGKFTLPRKVSIVWLI